MKNIALFAVTVPGYFGLWWWLGGAPEEVSGYAFQLGILALLCAPWNINGNIWTVLGNAESEKSIYSLCSLYQKAGKHAVTIIGVSSQQHAERNAVMGIGISFLQNAGLHAVTFIGISLYQNAGQDAVTFVGLSLYQDAEQDAYTGIGLSLYQDAEQDAYMGIGISLYQNAVAKADVPCGVALYQAIENEKGARVSRAFGVFSFLKFPEEPQEKAPPAGVIHCV